MGKFYDNKPWIELTEAEILEARNNCRAIPGWEDYWISADGTDLFYLKTRPICAMGNPIISHRHPICTDNGYCKSALIKYTSTGWLYDYTDEYLCASTYKLFGIHVLVALAWIGLPANAKLLVRHLDGIPANNHHSNLAWGTHKDNGLDTRWHNKIGKGKQESVRPECRKIRA